MCVSVYVCKPKHFTTSLPNMDSLGVSQKGCLQLCLPHSHFFQENTLTHFDTHTSVTHPHCEFLNLAFGSSTTGLLLSLPGVSPVQKALCRFLDTHVAQRSGQKKPPDCEGYFFHQPKVAGHQLHRWHLVNIYLLCLAPQTKDSPVLSLIVRRAKWTLYVLNIQRKIRQTEAD